MSGHAYLIAAHENSYVLDRLLRLLDDERNHIYLHIDKKTRDFDFRHFGSLCEQAAVTFVPRRSVSWGDYSHLRAVLTLLRHATPGGHRYYHLLSGADLPLKPQDDIHDFFKAHDGEEFVGFARLRPNWVRVVHPTMRYLRSSHPWVRRVALGVERRAVQWQLRVGYDRTARFPMTYRKGSEWSSITHELAVYVLSEERTIRRMLRWAYIPNEFYMQTIVWNSDYRERVHDLSGEFANGRYLDWSQGGSSPRVLTTVDLPKMMASGKLFARKFDAAVDRDVIDQIYDQLTASARPH